MNYSENQIQEAKKRYNNFLRFETVQQIDIETIGHLEAERRVENHNNIVREIQAGNVNVEKEWKYFFLNEVVKAEQKANASKDKKAANKAASADILAPVKELRKLGEFGKWLNTTGNPYRKQHFNKKYTVEAVNEFLNQL
jgi:hypothetical protein